MAGNSISLLTYRARAEIVKPNEIVMLKVTFKDGYGTPTNLDAFPQLTITMPNGLVAFGPSSAGVQKIGTGQYQFDYTIAGTGPLGVFSDSWIGLMSGSQVWVDMQFICDTTQVSAVNSDGYIALGDDPGFDYSQTALKTINKLLKSLRARLSNDGMTKVVRNGVEYQVSCSIFSIDMLTTFLATSLMLFNEVPHYTWYKFDDQDVILQFGAIIVEGAALMAMASKALIERGKEFTLNDGVSFTPPTVSDLLNTQYSGMWTSFYDRLKFIKNSIRDRPLGLGVFRPLAASTLAMRLRHRRQGQIV